MTDHAVRCHGIGKQYRIGQREAYDSLRDAITRAFRARSGWQRKRDPSLSGMRVGTGNMIWALKDVSFDVHRGEVLGIVGRNGAGKSTLLKILSRITSPSAGHAEIRGRVGSLLEVGTGFHPELTGRENIFLNAAILGMKRVDIKRQFDAIVEFAEVERFIDTPVKRYSSGMYVRLAFAVAAHIEPEILVVDEVLAVGDASFQKRCLGRMEDIARGGRTVLFVSHNMAAVQSLCSRAVLLEGGRVQRVGSADDVVSHYLQKAFDPVSVREWPDIASAPGNEAVRLRSARVVPHDNLETGFITVKTPIRLEFEYWNLRPGARLNLSMHVHNEHGVMAFNSISLNEPVWHGRGFPPGLFRSSCLIPGDLLNDGMYRIQLMLVQDEGIVLHTEDDALILEVADSPEGRGNWHGKWQGVLRPILKWETGLISPLTAEPA